MYEKQKIYQILAEGLTCHVAFIAEGQPICIPTAYARIDDKLYIHGSIASRMLKTLKARTRPAAPVLMLLVREQYVWSNETCTKSQAACLAACLAAPGPSCICLNTLSDR